jgi:hypothetical protein
MEIAYVTGLQLTIARPPKQRVLASSISSSCTSVSG